MALTGKGFSKRTFLQVLLGAFKSDKNVLNEFASKVNQAYSYCIYKGRHISTGAKLSQCVLKVIRCYGKRPAEQRPAKASAPSTKASSSKASSSAAISLDGPSTDSSDCEEVSESDVGETMQSENAAMKQLRALFSPDRAASKTPKPASTTIDDVESPADVICLDSPSPPKAIAAPKEPEKKLTQAGILFQRCAGNHVMRGAPPHVHRES